MSESVLLRKLYASKSAVTVAKCEEDIHAFQYLGGKMEDRFNGFQLLIAQFRPAGGIMSVTSVALALLRAFNESDQYKSSARLTSDLATICVEDIKAKFVVEAHNQEEKFAGSVNARAREVHPPCPTCGRTKHPEDRCFVRYPELRRESRRGGKRH